MYNRGRYADADWEYRAQKRSRCLLGICLKDLPMDRQMVHGWSRSRAGIRLRAGRPTKLHVVRPRYERTECAIVYTRGIKAVLDPSKVMLVNVFLLMRQVVRRTTLGTTRSMHASIEPLFDRCSRACSKQTSRTNKNVTQNIGTNAGTPLQAEK